MKKTIFLIALALFTAYLFISTEILKDPYQYCAQIKDGILVVMYEGNRIISEVTLDNGTKIRPDGIIIRIDGTRIMLKQGDCIDMEGKITEENPNKKTQNK